MGPANVQRDFRKRFRKASSQLNFTGESYFASPDEERMKEYKYFAMKQGVQLSEGELASMDSEEL